MESIHTSSVIPFSFHKTGSLSSFKDVNFARASDVIAVICCDVWEICFDTMLKQKKKFEHTEQNKLQDLLLLLVNHYTNLTILYL